MSKPDPVENALNALSELRTQAPEVVAKQLRSYLANRSNLVVAKAAKIAGELPISQLTPELVAAFHRFMENPAKLDKRCAALTEIAAALYQLDYRDAEVYLAGVRHVQKEGAYGPPVDAAASLRGICAQALMRSGYPAAPAEVVNLLIDPEPPARLGAIRALATNGGDAGVLLLRLKVLNGDDEPEVLRECFSGLLQAAPEASLPFVAKYVDDEHEAIAEAAIWALGESRQTAALEVLKQKWERTVGRPARKVLLAAISASRLEEALAFMRSLLATANVQTAGDVLAALVIYKGNLGVKLSIAVTVRERGDKALIDMFENEFKT